MCKKKKYKKDPKINSPKHNEVPEPVEPEVILPNEKEISGKPKDPQPSKETPPISFPDDV